ncbi:MAG: hypothetical protein D3917_02555 [Candidatus Electrothrix sp. AX5]|nr:hypothetical protein [Candidatus Electrothrix sp. AX5]
MSSLWRCKGTARRAPTGIAKNRKIFQWTQGFAPTRDIEKHGKEFIIETLIIILSIILPTGNSLRKKRAVIRRNRHV